MAPTMTNININVNINITPDDYGIEPYDRTVEPITDLPAEFEFSVPGSVGSGYKPLDRAKAKLLHNDIIGFYYSIAGDTFPSRRLLHAIGCEYGPTCGWICKDFSILEPHIIPGSRIG